MLKVNNGAVISIILLNSDKIRSKDKKDKWDTKV